MGQKVNPIGFRVGFNRAWRSMWYASKKDFPIYLYEDAMIRKFIKKKLEGAAVSKVTIERAANRVRVNIHTARPGVVIGRKAAELDKLKDEIRAITTKDREILVDVKEIKNPELDAQLVAENIALQIERRITSRRAMKKAVQTTMDMAGAEGIRVRCSGRLGGAEIARTEEYREGKVPLHTLRANIDYGFAEAQTVAGQDRHQMLDLPQGRSRSRQRLNKSPNLILLCLSFPNASNTANPSAAAARALPRAIIKIDFGSFALQTLERAWITNVQIEAARVALTRNMKRKGKLWIRIFPDKSVTARPPETRMGKGKGAPEYWVAVVKPGNILFELDGLSETVARESLRLAATKLAIRTRFISRARTN